MASEKEAAEFEQLCREHPELQEARIRFEISLEENAHLNAVAPPQELKEKIWKAIQADTRSTAKVVSIGTKKTVTRKLIPIKWAVAASILLMLTAGYFVWDSERIKKQLAQQREKMEELDALTRLREQAELPDNLQPKQVKVNQPSNAPASIKVYWDSTNTSVYLVITDLVKLPAGEKYQLWAIKGNKHTSMGLFDAPAKENERLIMKMEDAQQADSFAISIIKVDGKKD
jgi:hypothetical protein